MFFGERFSPISHLGTRMGKTVKQVHIYRHTKNNRQRGRVQENRQSVLHGEKK